MPEPGYVYVLINPSLKGLVKIGRTAKQPQGRAAELSGTALPTAFEVVYDAYFADAQAVERFIHSRLTEGGFRRASNREFFEMAVSDAVKAVVTAQAMFPNAVPDASSDGSCEPAISSLDELCDFADDLYFGLDDVLEDEERAIGLYRKAAAAGSWRGVLGLARASYFRESAVEWGELRPMLQLAMDAGIVEAHAYMAIGMIRRNHSSNARKCWNGFFRDFAQLAERTRLIWAVRYIRLMDVNTVTASDREALRSDRERILAFVDENESQIQVKARQILGFDGFAIEEQPRIRGEVVSVDVDGFVRIRFRGGLVTAEPQTVANGMTLSRGQHVEFVEDPLTHRVRFVTPV